MEFHEVANIFPLLTGNEFESLRDDIKTNGLLEPIVIHEGKILDGRNRYTACLGADVFPDTVDYDGNDPLGYVLSKNLHRRHLNESQRGIVGEKIETMLHGGDRQDANLHLATTRSEAAELVNVSPRTIASVAKIRKEAPELIPAIESGELRVGKAVQQINRAERVEKILEAPELLTEVRYPVIYADPPWRYEHSKTDNRKIENQYPTMSLDELYALPVSKLATDDAVLLLWATSPKLEEAMWVISAWDFVYRTNMVWIKDKIGMGYYARQQHELLLIATRGSLPVPEPANRHSSIIEGPRVEHSKKPVGVYDIIEGMYPEYSKIELFGRQQRAGWVMWGNEV